MLAALGAAIWRPVAPITWVAMGLTGAYAVFAAVTWSVNLLPLAILALVLLAGVSVVPSLFERARALTKARLGEA